MNDNKWRGLEGKSYKIEDLGRPAVFLLPLQKLKKMADGATTEENLHRFLTETFGAFTTTTIPYFGFWRGNGAELTYDECILYEVSFAGKEKVPLLLAKLAEIADAIGEKCIYFKAGQYACLVYPKPLN